jgi:putative iron-regulated protein
MRTSNILLANRNKLELPIKNRHGLEPRMRGRKMKTKLWLGVGSAVLAGSLLSNPNSENKITSALFGISPLHAQSTEGGEAGAGGEGGEGGGGALATYAISSTNPDAFKYDAKAQVKAYIEQARDSYTRAGDAAQTLEHTIDAFLKDPTEPNLALARQSWVQARPSYLVTEVYRFFDSPIEEVEGRVNAWPMNEAAIDYVKDNAKAGLINRSTDPVTAASLIKANQAKDEADVTTGWHAIEFLLWGQDLSADGPGARPAADFIAGTPANDRRRTYLHEAAELLEQDIKGVAAAWNSEAPGGYATKLKAMPEREVLGRAMNGMAILAGFEFMSARLAVALDSGDQEDEHSCFSDTTHQDFVYDLAGIKAVWTGDSNGAERIGIDALVRSIDKPTADKVDALIANAETKIVALGDPWDKVLAADPSSPERKAAEATVASLQALGKGLTEAGGKLGVLVLIPAG